MDRKKDVYFTYEFGSLESILFEKEFTLDTCRRFIDRVKEDYLMDINYAEKIKKVIPPDYSVLDDLEKPNYFHPYACEINNNFKQHLLMTGGGHIINAEDRTLHEYTNLALSIPLVFKLRGKGRKHFKRWYRKIGVLGNRELSKIKDSAGYRGFVEDIKDMEAGPFIHADKKEFILYHWGELHYARKIMEVSAKGDDIKFSIL